MRVMSDQIAIIDYDILLMLNQVIEKKIDVGVTFISATTWRSPPHKNSCNILVVISIEMWQADII